MPRLLTLQLAALPLDPTPLVLETLQCTSVLTMPSRCTFLLSPCSLAPCTFWSPGRWASLECAWRASPGRSTTSLMRATVAARVPMPSYPHQVCPDWCFGLLKQKFRKEPVSSLKEMEATVRRSTLQEVNIAQLVGDERGTVFVPMYDWQAFLIPFSKAVKGIKQYHHFSFSHQAQGVVMATTNTASLSRGCKCRPPCPSTPGTVSWPLSLPPVGPLQ